jgi:hypothetical protein
MSHLKHFTWKYCLLISAFLLISLRSEAQNYVDLFRLSYSTTPENSFDTSQALTRLQEVAGELTFPQPLSSKVTLINGLNYEMIQASVMPMKDPATVHGIMMRSGLSIAHGSNLKGNYFLLPKLSSDLRSIGRRDWQFGFLALLRQVKSPNFTWQYGAMFNTELFGPFMVPLLGFYYKSPSKKLEMNFLLPASADMNCEFGKRWHVGMQFVSMVKSFHLQQQIPDFSSAYWVKSTNELFAYVQMRFGKVWLIQSRIGYSVARRYYAYDIADKIDLGIMAFKFGDERTALNPFFEDGLIFQFRCIYRFHFPAEMMTN